MLFMHLMVVLLGTSQREMRVDVKEDPLMVVRRFASARS